LILDEATSSLDTESERLIQLSIDALAGHKEMVIIVIAHRLSTIKSANYIYILKGGVVIESGAYDELLREKDGTFRKMVADQGGILVQEVAGVESNLSIKQP
jgi:ABC-type multidrug transport system fused ATPase/permease subunit